MYAVLNTGGKQYKVSEGDVLKIEKLTADVDSIVELTNIMAVSNGEGELKIGSLKELRLRQRFCTTEKKRKSLSLNLKPKKTIVKSKVTDNHLQKLSSKRSKLNMIQVRFIRESGLLTQFIYDGHADYDDYGKDIVCAAVTAQCMMVYNGLNEIMKIKNELVLNDNGGYLSVNIQKASLSEKKEAQILLETLLLGIKAILLQYEKFINLIEEEV